MGLRGGDGSWNGYCTVVLMFKTLSLGPGFHLLIMPGAWRKTAEVE